MHDLLKPPRSSSIPDRYLLQTSQSRFILLIDLPVLRMRWKALRI
nr:MAG TPA: hypothetical protein [Caudoviricetes sp.]